MSTVVIMPGGFHPFHAGHTALYNSAREAFPDAEVYVAASNDTKNRPFPFAIKEKLAKVAGVQPGHFVQVKSPFQPKEITQNYNPDEDVVIFVRSQKDMKESPIPGGFKKNGEPAYFQPFKRGELEPFGKHAYMAYLPTVEFGPGITSATEIRNVWPTLDDKRKTAMVMSLYPATQKNPKLAANVVQMLDMAMGNELDEDISRRGFLKGMGAAAVAGGANAGQYQSSNEISPKQIQQIWNPKKNNLEKRCYAILKSFVGSSMVSHPDWAKIIQKIKINTTLGDKAFHQGNAANARVSSKVVNGKPVGVQSGQIGIETTVFWDAPNDTLAFILGHECGHIIMNHGLSPASDARNNEIEADLIGAQLAKKIGYDRASFFKFLFNAKVEQLRNGSPNDPHLEPTDRVNMLKQKADFELSKNSVEYIDSLAQQLKQGLAEGWKERLGAAALAGSMALGANARVTPDGQGGFTGGIKPSATVTAPDTAPTKAEAPQGFSKEYLQKAADPNRTGRYMISVARAQELLNSMKESIEEGVGDIRSSRQLGDIANDLGNGYVLVDDSYDDDDGFVKAMYGVYHQEGEDQYRFVGWVNTRSSYRYTQEEFNQAVQDLVDNDKQKLKEFASTGGDDREPDEEEILRQLAAQWWNGTEQQMKKAQQTLQAMGWEIGQDESGDDDAGVFLVRIGDINGDSYIAFNHSDLNLNEYNVRQTKKFIQRAHDKEQGQRYGNQPYSSHPKAVAAIGKKFFGSTFDSEAVKVALLHDVLEDTPYTPEQLSQKGFSNEVIKAVQLLTKNKAMSYADNIRTIINSGNKLAMMVKYCDNYMNYTGDKSHWDSDRVERSQKKYLASLNMLGDVLGIKKHIGDKETNVTESMDYLEEK